MRLEINITKQLKDYELKIEFSGEISTLGILGKSGSGKSMTLKCLAGIETPDSGYIILDGVTYFDAKKRINLKPQKRQIGFLFQDYALFPHMTVKENIQCSVVNKKSQKAEGLVEKLVKMFKLNGYENSYPSQLSGGQKQRVAFARLLAYEPKLLLLDEPFSALDSQLREYLHLEFLEMMNSFDGGVVMVTHSRDEVYRLCSDIATIEDGQILRVGSSKEVFSDPKFLSVAKLTGCKNFSRINRIDSNHLQAVDWAVMLKFSMDIPKDATYIGIRAHDLQLSAAKICNYNLIPVSRKQIIEAPFEWLVLYQSQSRDNDYIPIWWKCSKAEYKDIEHGYLVVDPEKIMFLIE